jgi:hypothetical protein
MFTGLADLVDALARSKLYDLDLRRQDSHFIVIEQGK